MRKLIAVIGAILILLVVIGGLLLLRFDPEALGQQVLSRVNEKDARLAFALLYTPPHAGEKMSKSPIETFAFPSASPWHCVVKLQHA